VNKLALKRYAHAMTDSIKHFTGFDISGKTEADYLQREWESKWKLWGKENY
jgi:hypothetical protein